MPEKPLLPNALSIQDLTAPTQTQAEKPMNHAADAFGYLLGGLASRVPKDAIRFIPMPGVPIRFLEYQTMPPWMEIGPTPRRTHLRGRGGKSSAMEAMANEYLRNNPGAKMAKVSIKDGQEVVHTTEAGGELQLDADGVYRPKP